MSKLKLDVDALEVTSFETHAAPGARGTVLGAGDTDPEPSSNGPAGCFESHNFTGPCCEYTLMLSCVQTNCEECGPSPILGD